MKYGLIGCGRISTNHIKAALDNNIDIVAICDIESQKMQELLSKHNLEKNKYIKRYKDYKKMIEENEFDFISIATESGSHAEIALYCIRKGINIIIEKPIAMGIKDAQKIVDESKKFNVQVAACHQNRFNLAVQKVKKALDDGRFGKISHGSIHVRWNRNKNYYEQAKWRGKWATDGGALMNQCIHGIDLLRWLLGDDIEEVYGVTKQQFHDYLECEDVGLAVLKFKNGTVATVEGTTNVFPRNLEETLYIFGEQGTVKLGGKSANAIDVWNFKDEQNKDKNACFEEEVVNVYGNGHTRLFADFIDSIKNDRKPYVDANSGLKALEVVLAIYKSSFSGKPVKLPLKNCNSTDFIGRFDG